MNPDIPSFEVETLTTSLSCQKFLDAYYNQSSLEELCRVCPKYGRSWTCPPLAFLPDFIWREYEQLELICDKVTLHTEKAAAITLNSTQNPEELINEFKQTVYLEAKKQMEERLLLQERQNPPARALFPGSCNRCESCQRAVRKPCLAPENIRYSIEALGGNVAGLIKEELGLEFDWTGSGQMPSYYLLVGGVLH